MPRNVCILFSLHILSQEPETVDADLAHVRDRSVGVSALPLPALFRDLLATVWPVATAHVSGGVRSISGSTSAAPQASACPRARGESVNAISRNRDRVWPRCHLSDGFLLTADASWLIRSATDTRSIRPALDLTFARPDIHTAMH